MSQIPPSDIAAERALIGAVTLLVDDAHELCDLVAPAAFYKDAHTRIWEALGKLVARGEPTDTVNLRAMLGKDLAKVGGDEYLLEITQGLVPTRRSAESYARRIRQLADVRALMHAANTVVAEAYDGVEDLDDFLQRSEQALADVAANRDAGDEYGRPFSTAVTAAVKRIRTQYESSTKLVGVTTGFAKLDEYTTGFSPGDLVILAARPSMGKTALGCGIAKAAAATGAPVAFASLEMEEFQLCQRYLADAAELDGLQLRRAELSRSEWRALTKSADSLSDLPIWIGDKPGQTLIDLGRQVSRCKRKFGDCKLLVVDYLQLMRGLGKRDSREQEVAQIANGLKALAKRHKLAVLALSQLNRKLEERGINDRRPQLGDLRESGAIEQDADVVLFVYRDEVYKPDGTVKLKDGREVPNKGRAEIIVGKQRQGPTGIVRVRWRKEFMRFEDSTKAGVDPWEQEVLF